MFKPRFLMLATMILGAALVRLIPHPWNFTPVAAMALFGGAYFTDKKMAYFLPLAALFISDIFIGFYFNMIFVYGSFALIVFMGMSLQKDKKPGRVVLTMLAGSVSFFLITNFGTWLTGTLYPKTFSGLMMCYSAGIPWFRSTIASDLFFTSLLFGSFAIAEKRFSVLRPAAH